MADERQVVTEEEHIRRLNEELPNQDQYEEGMAFIAYPEGAAGREVMGISMVEGLDKPGVFAQVHHAVDKKFRVHPTRKQICPCYSFLA